MATTKTRRAAPLPEIIWQGDAVLVRESITGPGGEQSKYIRMTADEWLSEVAAHHRQLWALLGPAGRKAARKRHAATIRRGTYRRGA